MRALWLPQTLREAGLPVDVWNGWAQRGFSLQAVNGIVLHHTGSDNDTDPQTEGRILRDGHSRVPGPLAQLGLDRTGRWHVIAAGRCNHAGAGQWPGLDGNPDTLGIEMYGRGDWPTPMLESLVTGLVWLLPKTELGTLISHREWAPGRKTDPWDINMDDLRNEVAMAFTAHEEKTLKDLVAALDKVGSNGWALEWMVKHLRDHPQSDAGAHTHDDRYSRKNHGHTGTVNLD